MFVIQRVMFFGIVTLILTLFKNRNWAHRSSKNIKIGTHRLKVQGPKFTIPFWRRRGTIVLPACGGGGNVTGLCSKQIEIVARKYKIGQLTSNRKTLTFTSIFTGGSGGGKAGGWKGSDLFLFAKVRIPTGRYCLGICFLFLSPCGRCFRLLY